MPELGKGTSRIHTPAPQLGSLSGGRSSHLRLPWRPVAQDLLPLPLPEVMQISDDARLLSRPVRQRLLRRRAMDLRVAETVQAMNFLDGHTWDPNCRPSKAQNAALEAIRREVELSPPPLDGSSPEAALQELLGPLSSYSGEHVAQAAYEPDLVSLPEVAGGCDIASQLEGSDRDCLVSFEESLLLSADACTQRGEEEGLPTLHRDEALVGDVYISFVNRVLQSGMLTLSLGRRSQAGIFFVRKKSGRLRMIADGRQGNQRMRPPPKTSMPSAAAFSELRLAKGEKVRVSTCDKDPQGIRRAVWIRTDPGLQAGSAGGRRKGRGSAGLGDARAVLPMGCSWALHFCQQAHVNIALRTGLGRHRLLLDKTPVPLVSDTEPVVSEES